MSAAVSSPDLVAGSALAPRTQAAPGVAVLRLAGLALWTGGCAVGWAIGSMLCLPPRSIGVAWRRWCFRAWARGMVRLLGIALDVRGAAPQPPFLLVANHLSYVDIVVLAATVPGIFVAKREVEGWPVWGTLARAMATVFIHRDQPRDAARVVDQLAGLLALGEGVVVFPEGTSTAGAAIHPLRPALLEAAVRQGTPVHYATLSYRTPVGSPPAELTVCWWGDMAFGPHLVELCRLSGFTARIDFGANAVVAPDRKKLARRLERALARQFIPTAVTESPCLTP